MVVGSNNGCSTVETDTAGFKSEGEPESPVGEPESPVYVWEVPGKPVAVHLELDVVDRLGQDALSGLGAVPRRGVESGGILLGSIQPGDPSVVRIEGFEPVPCIHTRGPAYWLSDNERQRFTACADQWGPVPGRRTIAVSFYRTHMREGLGLTDEDLELFNLSFREPSHVALLIKPFATRPSVGGFFIREDGSVRADDSHLEFPFRRLDLESKVDSADRSGEQPVGGPEPVYNETVPKEEHSSVMSLAMTDDPITPPTASRPASVPDGGITPAATAGAAPRRRRSSWIWLPLSFIFLLVGIVIGFQTALNLRWQLLPTAKTGPYVLNLSATPNGNNLHLSWDRGAPAIESAQRGTLLIQDGPHQKIVNLDAVQLQNGSIIYRRASNEVRFRLDVFAREGVSVSETVDVRLDALPSKLP